MSTNLITDLRLQRINRALVLGMLIGLLGFMATGKRADSAFFQGDFPAFYAAAEIVWSGRGAKLYDFELQRDLQNQHWPEMAGEFLIYPYPPFFAIVLSPLAAVPPYLAKSLASIVLLVSLVTAIFLSMTSSLFLRQHFLFCCLFIASLVPTLAAMIGIQNTTISLLCFSLVYWALRAGRPVLMGFSASLLLYKPQFGVLFLMFFIARGQREELLGWTLGTSTLYLLGSAVMGFSWPMVWLSAATHFGNLNFTTNNYNMISIAGLVYWCSNALLGIGAASLPWAYISSAVILMISVWYVRQENHRFILAPALVLLLSPQTLYYDVAIAVFFLMWGLRPYHTRDFMLLAGIWIFCVVGLLLRDLVTFPLFNILLVTILLIDLWRTDGHYTLVSNKDEQIES
jgi:hypothetical protein